MRDKDLEAKVDERLLLRFDCLGWSDENENKEDMDEKNCISLEEIKGLKGPEDDFLKEVEITSLINVENGFQKETKSDLKTETENGVLKKDDP